MALCIPPEYVVILCFVIQKWLSEKKVTALVQKRIVKDESKSSEPPAKQIKLESVEQESKEAG